MRPVDGFEEIAEAANRLGDAEDQEAGAIQSEMEDGEQPFLKRRRHVDQHIAAGHQVDARERWVDGEILSGEDAQVAHALLDPVVPVLLDEEPAQPLRADLVLNTFRVDASARPLEGGRVAQVGCEDLDAALGPDAVQVFEQRDGDRIRLLPGRATGRPRTDGPVVVGRGDERRQHMLLERLEHRRLTEETRDVDEDVAVERIGLAPVTGHQFRILAGRADAVQQHAPRRAPLDGRVPVVAEVHAGTGPQRGDDLLELGVLVDGLEYGVGGDSDEGVTGQLGQLGADRRRGHDQVDRAAGDGATRHA